MMTRAVRRRLRFILDSYRSGRSRDVSTVALVALAACACTPGETTAARTLVPFFEAVQTEDLDSLFCLVAGASEAAQAGSDPAASRAVFDQWAQDGYDAYLEGRDRGWVELDDQGLALVKLFALGRGTFLSYAGVSAAGPDAFRVVTDVRFGYSHIDLSRFTPGTTFYFGGAPTGRVEPVRVPHGSGEVSAELLESARIVWTLVRTPPAAGCPGGWVVATAEPAEGSEITSEVTWVF